MSAEVQQVNLLSQELMPKREHLTLRQVGFAMVGSAVLLGLVSAYQGWQADRLTTKNEAQQQQADRLAADNERLRGLHDGGLAAKRASLEELLEQQRVQQTFLRLVRDSANRGSQTIADSASQAAGATKYSDQLVALATHVEPGLWLDQIGLSRGGIDLFGSATGPVLVPRFADRLIASDEFRGQYFAGAQVEVDDDGVVRFAFRAPEAANDEAQSKLASGTGASP